MIYRSDMLSTLLQDDHPLYSFSGDVSLDCMEGLTKQVYKNHARFFEFSIDDVRFDLLMFDPARRHVTVAEFKTNDSDLYGDRKWPKYLRWCHRFLFVVPLGVGNDSTRLSGEDFGMLMAFRWSRRDGSRSGVGGIWVRRPTFREMDEENYHGLTERMLLKLLEGRRD